MSPHLDDAVFSVGASIRHATRHGVNVDVVTVLAGDPDSTRAADRYSLRAGFSTMGEAASRRREEDRQACELLGATAFWLPLSDDGDVRDPAAVRQALAASVDDYDAILLPGFPLAHADHRLVSTLALEVLPRDRAVGLYVEQPYASWHALARSTRPGTARTDCPAALGLDTPSALRWQRHVGAPADWVAKGRAMSAYVSQLAVLRRGPRIRIVGYEALRGGEAVLWLTVR